MTLTAKQQAQVNKAPQSQKAAMRAAFTKQNNTAVKPKKQPSQSRPVRVSSAAVVPRSVGYAFDGFDKRHLPLDEYTAPYTTTNFVSVMEFSSSAIMDQVIVVCPRLHSAQEFYIGPLTDFIAVQYDASESISGSIQTLATLRCPIVDAPTQGTAELKFSVRARLHNMSVRLSCLGTNNGMYPPGSVYLGAVPAIETGPHSTGASESLTIKQAWADDSIAVGYIKPVSAASLQENPIVLNACVAENVSYKTWRDIAIPGSAVNAGTLPFSTALEPIVLYIPRAGTETSVVNYRLEVGQQWCSRQIGRAHV